MKDFLYEYRFILYGFVIAGITKTIIALLGYTLTPIESFLVLTLIGIAATPPIFKLDKVLFKNT